jgi:hemolysin III
VSEKGYSLGEEIANAVTHGVGAALAIAGLAVAAVVAAKGEGGAWSVVPVCIYGSCLVLMFLFSTLYHSLPKGGGKRVFRILDHEAIFLMIAGTYTPFALTTIRGEHPGWGWTVFGVIWGLAVGGMVFQALCTGKYRYLATGIYVAMGWLIVVALKPLASTLAPGGMKWLWIGGACYTAGALVYLFKHVPYHHAVWHLAVLGGAICHYFGILFYVA